MSNRKLWVIAGLAAVFLLFRLPGIDLPYHQDEWKNVSASSSIEGAGKFYAHPPLMQMIFVAGHSILGDDYMRVLPLLFAIASAILLFVVVRNRYDKKAAIWATAIFSICFYNILGSLVPDVDGAILPFFFLLAVYFYDKWNAADYSLKSKWLALLVGALLIGFLIKLNFIIVVGVIILDYLWSHRRQLTIKKSLFVAGASVAFGLLYVALLYLIKLIYPAFDMSIMLGHANQFSEELGRNWIQIAVQASKAIFYLSPLLIVPLIWTSKEIIQKTRIFEIYLVLGFIFYFVLFDFSRGALDKYLMFAIVPLAVIVGLIFSEIFATRPVIEKWRWSANWAGGSVLIGIVLTALLIALNFLTHEVLPLYPKELWFSRVVHGEWLMLNPFNGGSGPLGFYISFLFIAGSFIVSAILAKIGFFKKEWRLGMAIVLLMIGLAYNLVFAEEFLFGKINGSAPRVLAGAVEFIGQDKNISKVITYNDIGAGPLSKVGKYAGRIYATPQSEEGYKALFAKHTAADGHFLVVGIPPLGPDSFYGKYFSGCDSLFSSVSGEIRADVYDCR